jgi:signal peptidase I
MAIDTASSRKSGRLSESVRTIAWGLVIALAIRTFLVEPFSIPSGSMEPTLLIGDYLFVLKFRYGYSHFSLPLSPPLFSGRILGSEPHRGDVAVFRPRQLPGTDFIKRVIGLPGDRIQVLDGVVQINGVAVRREPEADFVGADPCGSGSGEIAHVKQWRETLPDGVSYHTLQCSAGQGFPNTTPVYAVPPGNFFMMGDNRDNSEDSRFPDVGLVPFENLVGPAELFFFSVRGSPWAFWQWPWTVRWNRVLRPIG